MAAPTTIDSVPDINPCMDCGACCANFRVSFHWMEADDAGGKVPVALTEALPPHRRCMTGTNSNSPRCIALEGKVGEATRCTIYDQRPSPCHEFNWIDEQGAPDDACRRARAAYGLPPVQGQAALLRAK